MASESTGTHVVCGHLPGDPSLHALGWQVWAAPLAGGGRGVVLFNRQFPAEGHQHHNITLDWALLGYAPSLQVLRMTCRGTCNFAMSTLQQVVVNACC